MAAEILAPYVPDRESIEALSKARVAEPQSVLEARLTAFEKFAGLPAPSERSDGWRRTDLTGIDLSPVAPSLALCDIRVSKADADRGVCYLGAARRRRKTR